MKAIPSQSELQRLLDYNPDTGLFRWRVRGDPWWDRRFAGKKAFPCFNAGYCVGSLGGKRGVLAHRVAYKYMTGCDPNGEVDHINGDRTDNRFVNLRLVDTTGNRRNSARPSHNTSGTVGVHYRSDKKRWVAFITIDNRYKYLGYFAAKEDAIARRAAAEREYGFHPNHGRAA